LLASEKEPRVAQVDNAIFVVEGLRETAEKLRDDVLAGFALALVEYMRDKPKPGDLLCEPCRDVLNQCVAALESYKNKSEDAAVRLQLLTEKLRDEIGGAKAEEEPELFDDEIILELQKKLEDQGDRSEAGLKGKIRRLFKF